MSITTSYGENNNALSRDIPLIAGGYQTLAATPQQLWHLAGASGTVLTQWPVQYPGYIVAIHGFHYLNTGSTTSKIAYQVYKSTAGGAFTALAGCISGNTTPNTSPASIGTFSNAGNAYPFAVGDALALFAVPTAAVTVAVLMQINLTVSYV